MRSPADIGHPRAVSVDLPILCYVDLSSLKLPRSQLISSLSSAGKRSPFRTVEVPSGLDPESKGKHKLVLRNCSHNLNIRKGISVNMLPDFLKTKEKLKKMHNTEMKKAQFRHRHHICRTNHSTYT